MRSLLTYPLRLLGGLVDRFAAVIGAVAMSQFPGFVQHYVQRLGGHVTEAAKSVAGWQAIADSTTGGSLPELIAQYQGSALPQVIEAGNKCAGDLERLVALRVGFDTLSGASTWGKGWAFLRHCDGEVFGATAQSFVPNLPLDVESLCYAAVGLVLAVVLLSVARSLAVRTIRSIGALIRGRLAGT